MICSLGDTPSRFRSRKLPRGSVSDLLNEYHKRQACISYASGYFPTTGRWKDKVNRLTANVAVAVGDVGASGGSGAVQAATADLQLSLPPALPGDLDSQSAVSVYKAGASRFEHKFASGIQVDIK